MTEDRPWLTIIPSMEYPEEKRICPRFCAVCFKPMPWRGTQSTPVMKNGRWEEPICVGKRPAVLMPSVCKYCSKECSRKARTIQARENRLHYLSVIKKKNAAYIKNQQIIDERKRKNEQKEAIKLARLRHQQENRQ